VPRLRIVLADDHEDFRRSLSSFLKLQAGIDVIGEAVDGDDAIVQTESKQPDLVLMDLEMPKRDGFEATREIKRRWPKTRVVVLSAYSSEVYRHAAREYLADGFIDKNSMKDALLAVLMDEQSRRFNVTTNAA
jgi:two-component system invasion response regulator UvrY